MKELQEQLATITTELIEQSKEQRVQYAQRLELVEQARKIYETIYTSK